MRRIGIDKATEAGSTAGHRWASASRNIPRLERLRDWLSSERRGVGDLNRFVIYSCFLTDRFMVGGPAAPQQYSIPMLKAERLADGYWERLGGWPQGARRQARFVEGFVRGAVALAVLSSPWTRVVR
jgi:hypothetical protein